VSYLVAGLESESRIAHENTAARLGSGRFSTRQAMTCLAPATALAFTSTRAGIDAGDDTRGPIDLASTKSRRSYRRFSKNTRLSASATPPTVQVFQRDAIQRK